jgi:hypothetical protein
MRISSSDRIASQFIRLVGGITFLLLPNAVLAQAQGMLTVTFAPAGGAIPLSPWIAVLSSLTIIGLAIIFLRRRVPHQFGNLSTWFLASAFIAALVAATEAGLALPDANAQQSAIPFPLTMSPASIGFSSVPSTFTATNQTGAPIRFTSMVTNVACVAVAVPPSTCLLGQTLQAGQSCTIGIQMMFPPC